MAPNSPATTDALPGRVQLRCQSSLLQELANLGKGRTGGCSDCSKKQGNDVGFLDLPDEVQDIIFSRLEYKDLFRVKRVCKLFKARADSDAVYTRRRSLHPREGLLTALHFSVREDGVWRSAGYDLDAKEWKKLPPFAMLPLLDPNNFNQDHIICGSGGFFCVYLFARTRALDFSWALVEKMVVFHPMTQRWRELPPMNHPRIPVLMHMVVFPKEDSFKIIVAGSASTKFCQRFLDNNMSKVTEVFDSCTSKWVVTEEVPGPMLALNVHQTGAYKDGIVYCIAFLAGDRGRGLVAYDVEEEKWLSHLTCPLPTSQNVNTLQVENIDGQIVLFSEIHYGPYLIGQLRVDCRVDVLEFLMQSNVGLAGGMWRWRNMLMETRDSFDAGLRTYPKYTCVPFGEGKMCIFNTKTHIGDIYNMQTGKRIGKLSSPPWNGIGELNFFTFNTVSFNFETSFKSNLKLEHTRRERVYLV